MKTETLCLIASLTLLAKLDVLEETEVINTIKNGSFESLYDLLNEKYKEIEENKSWIEHIEKQQE